MLRIPFLYLDIEEIDTGKRNSVYLTIETIGYIVLFVSPNDLN